MGTYLLSGMTPDLSVADVMLWTSLREVGNALAIVPILTVGLSQAGPRGWLPYLEQFRVAVACAGVRHLFLLVAMVTAVSVLTALTFSGRRPDHSGPRPLEVGV